MPPELVGVLSRYAGLQYHSDPGGFVVWRRGSGNNVELLYLVVNGERRAGTGTRLLRVMLDRLRSDPPYATVYGFTRTSNGPAKDFYASTGFALSPVNGVYADGNAVVFSARYEDLLKTHFGDGK